MESVNEAEANDGSKESAELEETVEMAKESIEKTTTMSPDAEDKADDPKKDEATVTGPAPDEKEMLETEESKEEPAMIETEESKEEPADENNKPQEEEEDKPQEEEKTEAEKAEEEDLAAKSASYESASRKGNAVMELTVVNEDGSETISPVAKRTRKNPPAAAAASPAASEQDDRDSTAESAQKAKKNRLYFGRDRLLFTTMARAYIEHEIYKFDCNERWQLAIDEFYDEREMKEVVVRKPLIAVKRPFLSGLDSRIKALSKKPGKNENEEVKLCRQIKKLREEARKERLAKGQEEPEESRKKRKRAAGPESRGRPRITDIVMSPEMEQRYVAAQKVRDEEEDACNVVSEIEREIEEAQKRLAEAKDRKTAAAARAEEVSTEFSADVINGTGPWKEMFVQLQEYEAVNGTVNIIRGQTPEMKALRRWVLRQRERYHMKDDQKSKLPWYCARILESIGFLWRYSDGTWMRFYNELVAYKNENGDCAVPRGYKANPKLSQWVKRMRHEGNRFRENPSSVSMSAKQLKMLDDIGFIWENLSRSWNERFEDLKRFKAEHGHCRVPKVYPANPKLVSWCQNQRAHHRAFMLGKKTFIDAARKQQLEEVGFEWETGATPGRPPSSPDKKKRGRKKKEEIKEDSDSEEDVEQEPNAMETEEGGIPQPFAHPPQPIYQNYAFAHPNHAYANPYQQQPQPQPQPQRHFYPTL